MITEEQKKEIKKLANKYRFLHRKDRFVERSLSSIYLLENFDDDFDTQKYEEIKRYTEEWYG